jgi:hypothetical protein
LIFNLDEIGMSEWEDRKKKKKKIIPKTMDGQMIHHRASRNVKHRLIITCISAEGESLTPYIVTSQDSEPLRKRVMRHGVRMSVDYVLRQRSKSYVNSTLFLEYINKIFVLYFNELQEMEEFEACEAMLLMDNYSSHMPNDVIAILTCE